LFFFPHQPASITFFLGAGQDVKSISEMFLLATGLHSATRRVQRDLENALEQGSKLIYAEISYWEH